MKLLKIFGVLVILCAIVFTSFSCTSGTAATATPITRTATVTRGTLTNAITATGNLAYSTTEDLAFEIPGYVDKIDVSAGDTVKKGQELANVDTSTYQDTINSLTKALYNAQSALTSKQRTLTSKQTALAAAQRTVTSAQFALNQAQIDIDSANYNLSNIAQVKSAQDAIDSIQLAIDTTTAAHQPVDISLRTALITANQNLNSILATTNTNLTTSAALAITQSKQNVALKQKAFQDDQQAVADAQTAVVNAQLDIEQAKLDLAQAQQDVVTAQSNLGEANAKSPTIYAPFDGYITNIPTLMIGGVEVFKGSIAMTIADPTQFRADVLVTETDINTVKLDGVATVGVDALSLNFPAKITFIAPTATVSSGVVNFKVTVTLTSLTPISARQTSQGGSVTGNQVSGNTPPAGSTRPTGATPSRTAPSPSTAAPSGAARTAAAAAAATPNFTLKQGLSATVSIISQQKDNILYIPSRAITRQGAIQSVKVVNGTAIETRTVTTGMTDGTSTEILTGLTEGEQITYSTTTTASTTTPRTGGQAIPGIGRIGG